MVYIQKLTAFLGAVVAVNAYPDTVDWGKYYRQQYPRSDQGWVNGEGVKQHIKNACQGWPGNRGFYQDV
jgi:hypothetical protein